MADFKLSDLVELAVTPADADEFYINDGGVSKKITYGTLKADFVHSDPTGVTGADAITNMMSLTQAEYDAIVTPDASTLYVITD